MLTLFRSRRLLTSSVLSRQTRSIRSTPREIPRFLRRWDPTLHIPPRTSPWPAETNSLRNVAPNEVAYTETWKRQQARPQERLTCRELLEIPHKNLGPKQIDSVRNLIRLLRLAKVEASPSFSLSMELWNAYQTAKELDSELVSRISNPTWDILWNAQHVHGYSERHRLSVLERDMHSVGVTTTGRRARHLENVFVEEKQEDALKAWEDDLEHQDYEPEHLELGVRLYALAGNTDRALQVMNKLFELHPSWSPSIIMSVFRALTSSGTEEKYDLAKDIYLEMKKRMGADLKIETYDACLIGFLEARSLRYAKQVFRDMCRDGYLATSADAASGEELLKRLHLLYRLGTDISKMTSIALDVISVLPVSHHDYLFGSWMKCAVVQKAPEAAAQILDMMFRKGSTPSTFHFNLLLRALFRTGETSNLLQAENIGWHMIEQAKLEAIATDSMPHGPAQYLSREPNDKMFATEGSQHALGPAVSAAMAVPNASITTFSIIMQHHAKDLQWEHVNYLARQLKETGLAPNTSIMNVLIDSKCRQGRFSEAWKIYKSLTDNPTVHSIFPNGKTFRLLWKMLRLALSEQTQVTPEHSGLPTPRALLAETVRWWDMCRSRYDAERFLQGLAAQNGGAITKLMLHCFSFAQDLLGSLVAVHVLRHKFDIFPNDKTFEIIKRQMAWVDFQNETESLRIQFGASGCRRQNMLHVEAMFQDLLERRMKSNDTGNGMRSSSSREELGNKSLGLLNELMRTFMEKTHQPATVEAMINTVKDEVGVPDMQVGDTVRVRAKPSNWRFHVY
jgi:pentatricopeptide repeat protein